MKAVPPILTVTVNPAIDLNLVLEHWHTGDFVKARAVRRAAGGKGINVSRVLAELGARSTAVCLLAGPDGDVFLSLLSSVEFDVVPIRLGYSMRPVAADTPAATRTNVTLTSERTGRQIKVNQPGPRITGADWRQVEADLSKLFAGRAWVVLSGSLPPGDANRSYYRLIQAAKKAGARVAVDCSGKALLEAVRGRPDLIKPTRSELAEATGRPCRSRKTAIDGARRLIRAGARCVVVSHGGRECLAITNEKILLAQPPAIEPQSPMGAGDSMLAGMVFALARTSSPATDDDPLEAALRLGVACGAACASEPDTVLARQDQVRRLLPRVRVQRLRD